MVEVPSSRNIKVRKSKKDNLHYKSLKSKENGHNITHSKANKYKIKDITIVKTKSIYKIDKETACDIRFQCTNMLTIEGIGFGTLTENEMAVPKIFHDNTIFNNEPEVGFVFGLPLDLNNFDLDTPFKPAARIGNNFQAKIPLLQIPDDISRQDTLVWNAYKLSTNIVDNFCITVQKLKSKHRKKRFNIACDDESSLQLLLQCDFNVKEALRRIQYTTVQQIGFMSLWNPNEISCFEAGLQIHGKNFFLLQKNFLQGRGINELVNFYYASKKKRKLRNKKSVQPDQHFEDYSPLKFLSPRASINSPTTHQSNIYLKKLSSPHHELSNHIFNFDQSTPAKYNIFNNKTYLNSPSRNIIDEPLQNVNKYVNSIKDINCVNRSDFYNKIPDTYLDYEPISNLHKSVDNSSNIKCSNLADEIVNNDKNVVFINNCIISNNNNDAKKSMINDISESPKRIINHINLNRDTMNYDNKLGLNNDTNIYIQSKPTNFCPVKKSNSNLTFRNSKTLSKNEPADFKRIKPSGSSFKMISTIKNRNTPAYKSLDLKKGV